MYTFSFLIRVLFWAVYPVLFLYRWNEALCTPQLLVRPLLLSIVFGTILFVFFKCCFKSESKAACFSILVIIFFHLFGRIEDFLIALEEPWFVHMFPVGHQIALALMMIMAALFVRLKRRPSELLVLARALGWSGLLLCGFSVLPGGTEKPLTNSSVALGLNESNPKPDIYIVVCDAYASQNVLSKYYGFDNSDMESWLIEQGFYLAPRSRSNYGMSILSMTSAFNLNYLDEFFPYVEGVTEKTVLLKPYLKQNVFFESLREIGYRTVTFDAAVFGLMRIETSDLYFKTPGVGLNLLEQELYNSSAASYLFDRSKKTSSASHAAFHRHRINYAFDQLGKLPEKKGPLLVYAHMLSSHQPFVFHADGSARPFNGKFGIWFRGDEVVDKASYRAAYVEQIQYVNTQLKSFVQKIKNSERPSVIVLMSDHGPAMGLNVSSYDKTNLEERFSILSACYFPDEEYSTLYSDITPINLFRSILNKYFATNLPLLDDQSFYSTWSDPFKLIEVPLGDEP